MQAFPQLLVERDPSEEAGFGGGDYDGGAVRCHVLCSCAAADVYVGVKLIRDKGRKPHAGSKRHGTIRFETCVPAVVCRTLTHNNNSPHALRSRLGSVISALPRASFRVADRAVI